MPVGKDSGEAVEDSELCTERYGTWRALCWLLDEQLAVWAEEPNWQHLSPDHGGRSFVSKSGTQDDTS